MTTAATIHVPADYSSIQWAINNATPGDTILVNSGTYRENVVVNKTLNLTGVDVGGYPHAEAFFDAGAYADPHADAGPYAAAPG